MIKTSYDPAADALFVWLGPEGAIATETREVSPGVLLDYDSNGQLLGIEVLDVGRRDTATTPRRMAAE